MSLVVVVVSSEQVVKPRSRQAVVKPEVLHLLECQLCTKCVYELGQSKWVWCLIKWAWPKFSRALILQPHHCNNPRSAPAATTLSLPPFILLEVVCLYY